MPNSGAKIFQNYNYNLNTSTVVSNSNKYSRWETYCGKRHSICHVAASASMPNILLQAITPIFILRNHMPGKKPTDQQFNIDLKQTQFLHIQWQFSQMIQLSPAVLFDPNNQKSKTASKIHGRVSNKCSLAVLFDMYPWKSVKEVLPVPLPFTDSMDVL